MKFIKCLYYFIQGCLLFITLGACAFVSINAARLEAAYMTKYEAVYQEMIREHDRQLVIGELISSQQSWEETSLTFQDAFREERADKNRIERQYRLYEKEMYAFFRRLQLDHPDIALEMYKKFKYPLITKQNIKPILNNDTQTTISPDRK